MAKKTKKPKREEKIDGRSTKSVGGIGAGKTPRLSIRVDEDRRMRWATAAFRAGESLSEWLRRLADGAS